MKDDRLFDRARDDVSILAVAAALGIEVNAHGKALCPAHDDHRPSLSFKDNRCKCFSCQFQGSGIDLVMQVQGLDKLQAAQWILEQFSLSTGTERTSPKPARNQPKVEPRQQVDPAPPGFYSDIYNALIDQGQDIDAMPDRAREYLTDKRGLSRDILKAWKVRYYPPEVRRSILHTTQKRFQENDLRGAGILAISKKTGAVDYYVFFKCPYLFPFLGQGGRVLYIQGRISPEDKGKGSKYINPALPPNGIRAAERPILYGAHVLEGLPDGATVHLVEGIMDTLTVNDQGRPAAGIPGVSMFKERTAGFYVKALERFNVVFTRHNDKPRQDKLSAGQELERAVTAALHGRVAGFALQRIPDGIKDLNDWLQEIRKNEREQEIF